MASLKEIAKKANVSVATVSNVINNRGRVGEQTRNKIKKIIEDAEYRPNEIAKSLKIKRTGTIGVMVEDISVFNAPDIVNGIHEAAESKGLNILLTNLRLYKKFGNDFPEIEECKRQATSLYHQLIANQVEGIIYVGIHSRDITGLLPNPKKNIVYTYCYTTNKGDYSVNYDDEDASYKITQYLINKGHKNIGLISGLINSATSYARFHGYQKALSLNELVFRPESVKTGDWKYDSGYSMMIDLLKQKNTPTAIIAMNDLMAAGAIQAIKDNGYEVPRDFSVVGFDDREFSQYISPTITTMSLPLEEMGKKAVDILDESRNEPEIDQKKYNLACQLVERESVKELNE